MLTVLLTVLVVSYVLAHSTRLLFSNASRLEVAASLIRGIGHAASVLAVASMLGIVWVLFIAPPVAQTVSTLMLFVVACLGFAGLIVVVQGLEFRVQDAIKAARKADRLVIVACDESCDWMCPHASDRANVIR